MRGGHERSAENISGCAARGGASAHSSSGRAPARATLENARGFGGVELTLPSGWEKVRACPDAGTADPRTLLVIGTRGRAPGRERLPRVLVPRPVGRRGRRRHRLARLVRRVGIQPLSALKLRRGTFECFAGRGAFAQVTRRSRDFQVNVMVGDRATAETIEDALAAARSFDVVPGPEALRRRAA